MPRQESARDRSKGPGFWLFLLLNATMFIRPAEIIPALAGLPIYEVLMLGCLLASFPALTAQLTWASLRSFPGALCVLGLLPAVLLSHLSHGYFGGAQHHGTEFLKTLLYYLLVLGLVNSADRLKTFMRVFVVLVWVMAVLSLLQYHGHITLHVPVAMEQTVGYDEETGESLRIERLTAAGIFSDPNDFSLVLVAAVLVSGHLILTGKGALGRFIYSALIAVYLYALMLTHSRGGFLALLAGMGAYGVTKWGFKRTALAGVVLLPLLFVVFGGRQTNFNFGDEEDTGHARVELWAEGLVLFHASPVFGAGVGMMADEVGFVAHNSFVHCFAELGFFGGTLFVGAVFLPMWGMYRFGKVADERRAADVSRWLPCMVALLFEYTIGMCSLSRAYTISTYLIFGLAGAYCRLVSSRAPEAVAPLDTALVIRILALGVASIACIEVFVRVVT